MFLSIDNFEIRDGVINLFLKSELLMKKRPLYNTDMSNYSFVFVYTITHVIYVIASERIIFIPSLFLIKRDEVPFTQDMAGVFFVPIITSSYLLELRSI